MNNESKQLKKHFLAYWLLANFIGWLAGGIGAIILSYLVVNIFYPKETNLILGLCIGAGVGYTQWFVLKRKIKISSLWGLVCTICMGIPFIIDVIMEESGHKIPYFQGNYEFLGRLIFGIIEGLVIGLLQMQFLKPYFKKAAWWIAVSSTGWGICFLVSSFPMPYAMLGVIVGGILLGLITGFGIIWITRSTN
jgi:hypothetical protein